MCHYISCPVDDQNTEVFTGNYMIWFDEVLGEWNEILSADSVLATDLQGYALYSSSSYLGNTTVTFDGELNSGLKSISLTNTTAASHGHKGFNYVGNPFTSALDWNVDDGSGWTRTNMDNALWIWNPTVGNYGTYVKDAGSGTNDVDNIIPNKHQNNQYNMFLFCLNIFIKYFRSYGYAKILCILQSKNNSNSK